MKKQRENKKGTKKESRGKTGHSKPRQGTDLTTKSAVNKDKVQMLKSNQLKKRL
ncbi:hypothetical protein HYE38_04170 [Mycoplasmopsis bovis]|nr:hypothetical protein HYE38_04170 [Mycoplasmopsis bovis]